MSSPKTYRFTQDYQDLVLACVLKHADQMAYALPCMQPAFFGGVEATMVAEELIKYHTARNKVPTFIVLEELAAQAERRLGTERAADGSAAAYVRRLEEIDTSDWEYVATTIVEFAREQAARMAILKVVELWKEGKEPPGGYGRLMDEARQVGQNLDDLGLLLHADADATIDKVTSEEYGTSTGYPVFDSIWKMGWKPGWLIVPLAPPKFFKSTLSLNIALNMVSPALGYDVIYYACELSQELTEMRALCHLGRIDMDKCYESPETFKVHVNNAINKNVAGNLLFKSFASKSGSISDIRAHAKHAIAQMGLNVKAIFIDYAETVRPEARGKGESDWRQQANIYTDARALGAEIGCPIIMPDRCNADTVDKAVPNMKSFQGAFEKAGIVDAAIGLCGTEEERLANVIRAFVFLNRHGPAFQHIRGIVSPSHYRIEFDPKLIPYNPEDSAPDHGKRRQKGSDSIQAVLDDHI